LGDAENEEEVRTLDKVEDDPEGEADNGEEQGGADLGDNGQLGREGEDGYWGDDENEEVEGKGVFRSVRWHVPPAKRKWAEVSD